ncbi:MAG TPA: hypothetical protein VFV95_16985 [Vicinamibacterales bacterium]|nr:hypothetical protein [Vicinamibacterales bacterium]
MPASVLRVLLTVLLIGWASTAGADVCIAIDESRDTFAPRDRDAALLLVTTQFESEGERVVPPPCPQSFLLFHSQLGNLVVVTMSGQGKTWQTTALTLDDVPAIYSQMVRSIVTGRPMTGLNVVDRTNVTSSQAQAHRVHSDSLWYGRLGYGGVFADRSYGTPALGFGYRAELDSFAIDVSFINHQFTSPGSYASPRASAFTVLKLSGFRFLRPQANRSAYYGGGLSYGFRNISRGNYPYTLGTYTTSWDGSGLQGELTAGYELARATSLRVFVQADAVLPFYTLTSETRATNGVVSTDSRYAPSLVLSIGVGR